LIVPNLKIRPGKAQKRGKTENPKGHQELKNGDSTPQKSGSKIRGVEESWQPLKVTKK